MATKERGPYAELVVQFADAEGSLSSSGSTVMHIYDRFVLHNQSHIELEYRQAPPPPTRHRGGGGSSSGGSSGAPSDAPSDDSATTLRDAPIHPLPAGAQSAVHWERRERGGGKDGDNERLVTIRCNKGWRTYEWCAPFSLGAVGESIVKLRPSIESAATGGRAGSQQALYLRLTIRMKGSRRYIAIRPAIDDDGKLRLPYNITNRSAVLMAFAQSGCEDSDEHWDLLGAGARFPHISFCPWPPLTFVNLLVRR